MLISNELKPRQVQTSSQEIMDMFGSWLDCEKLGFKTFAITRREVKDFWWFPYAIMVTFVKLSLLGVPGVVETMKQVFEPTATGTPFPV